MVKFKDFSRPLSVFQVLFKAKLIFKRVLYIKVLFKPVPTLVIDGIIQLNWLAKWIEYDNEKRNLSRGMRFPTIRHFGKCRLDEPLQPPFKLRNSKWCSASSLTVINTQATSKDSDQTDCTYVQADLWLCWSHIPHCWKSHALAHLRWQTISSEDGITENCLHNNHNKDT